MLALIVEWIVAAGGAGGPRPGPQAPVGKDRIHWRGQRAFSAVGLRDLPFRFNRQWPFKRLVWLAVIPAITLVLAWTNEYHGLIWAKYIPYQASGLTLSDKIYGAWFWVYWGYSYLILLAATVLTIRIIRAAGQAISLAEHPGFDRHPGALGRQSAARAPYLALHEPGFGPDPVGFRHYRRRPDYRHVPLGTVRHQARRLQRRDRRHGGWGDHPR